MVIRRSCANGDDFCTDLSRMVPCFHCPGLFFGEIGMELASAVLYSFLFFSRPLFSFPILLLPLGVWLLVPRGDVAIASVPFSRLRLGAAHRGGLGTFDV